MQQIDGTTVRTEEAVFTNAYFRCTGPCGRLKPAKDIGLRKMKDGKIRNQAWCNKCRSEHKKK